MDADPSPSRPPGQGPSHAAPEPHSPLAGRSLDLLAGDGWATSAAGDVVQSGAPGGGGGGRPWLGVRFVCSGQYVRVLRDAGGTHYLARCPTCAKTVRFRVGPGGSDQRIYDVSCRE